MKKKLSREAKIGIFGVITVLFLYFGINYIKGQDFFSQNHLYYAVYEDAEGIEASSPVLVKGFQIGSVEKVRYDMAIRKVIVELSIRHAYSLPLHSEAKIVGTSLLGSKVIEIRMGDNSSKLMADGDTVRSVVELGLMEMATSEYDKLKAQATSLVDKISKVLDGVNGVLSPQNVANLSAMLANLNSATGQVDYLVKNDIAATMHDLRELSSTLRQTGPQLTNTVSKFSLMADTLSTSVPTLMASTVQAVDQLNTTLAAINNADGTVGKLIHNDDLYRNLMQVSVNLNRLVLDLQQNPGRYVHFSVFGGGK